MMLLMPSEDHGVSWLEPMIRVALFGAVVVIVAGVTFILAHRLIDLAETPNEAITGRSPKDGSHSSRRIQEPSVLALRNVADVDH